MRPRFCWQVPDKQTWSEHSKRAKWQVSVRRHRFGCVLTNPHLNGCWIQSHVPRSPRPFHFLVVVQLLSHLQLFSTPWTAAHQASLSVTISGSLLKLTTIESVMPSNHLILYCPLLLLPSSGDFPRSQFFTSGGQIIGASASATALPMNIQGWFPLRLIGLISLQSKGLSRVFSNTTVQEHQFFGTQLSL